MAATAAQSGPIHDEEALGKAYDARLMRRLLRYVRPYRTRLVQGVLLLVTGAALELVGPWLMKVALDRAIPAGDVPLLAWLAGVYLASLLFRTVVAYVQTLLTTWLGQRIMYDLRREVFGHLQRMSLPFFDRNPVGRLMTRVTSDVEVLNQLFSSGVVAVFGDVFTLVFIMGAMLIMDWRLALVSFAVLPLVALVAFIFRARVRDAYRDIRVRLARINAFLQERITGVRVIQLFGREREAGARFRAIDRDYLDAHLRSISYYALFFPVIELLTAVAFALIIAYGGAQILDGSLTVGVIAAFLYYARRFFRPIQDLSEKYNMLQAAMASSERIFKLLDSPVAIDRSEPRSALPATEPDIERGAMPVETPEATSASRDTRLHVERLPIQVETPETQAALPDAQPRLFGARPGPRPDAADMPDPPATLGTPRGEIEFRDVWFAYQRRQTEDRTTGPAPGREPRSTRGSAHDRELRSAVELASRDPAEPDGEGGHGRQEQQDESPGRDQSKADGQPPPEHQPADWDWVLRGVSFKARPGERVAIVGHTGAGKTTIISLLTRFYEPQRGEILLDGVPIRQLPPDELRRRIGLVLQDVFLFSRDIAYNIRLGRSDIDDAAIRAAATRVGADRFIDRLPHGYDERLGERGSSLSVGERQLLSFARALAFDPLVLVLDEATSSVDSELEEQIERAVETLMHGRTSLVIAHRLSTVQSADRILVLHRGELREQGTHQELLELGGIYARLHELQFAGDADGQGAASPPFSATPRAVSAAG